MSKFKRFTNSGTDYFHSDYVGENGELTWDVDNGLRLHDGSTAGGSQIQGGTNYGDANVAAYLPNYTGIVGATEVVGSDTNVEIQSGSYTWNFDNTGNITGLSDHTTITSGTSTWEFNLDGSLTLPLGGNITSSTFETLTGSGLGNVSAIELKPEGSISTQYLRVYPTIGEGNHVHVTTGDLNSSGLYIGDDVNHVRVGFGNTIVIGTSGGEVLAGQTWQFGQDGNLTLPYRNFSSAIGPTTTGLEFVVHEHTYKFGGDGSMTFPDATVQRTAYALQDLPASHLGKAGDQAGMMAAEPSYFYICVADYTGNGAAIWRRIPTDTNWNW